MKVNKNGFNRSYAGMHGNVGFKPSLVFLSGAGRDLLCHLYSPVLFAEHLVLLHLPIRNKRQNCQESHSEGGSLQLVIAANQTLTNICFLITAANFGSGTYFAVDASYSARDTYSKPDANGKKYMYLARVLVGEYSQGVKGAITPAAKDASNSIDLFDSSTDNVSRPSMFIIFNDIQAYPEYLLTFTR